MRDADKKNLSRLLKNIRSGFYALIILELLDKYGPLYGYKIKALIEEASNGLLRPSESTIYESLKQLEKNKLIKSFWGESEYGPPRKYYELTGEGRRMLLLLRDEVRKIIDLVNNIQSRKSGSNG